jgi:hypothetical protein
MHPQTISSQIKAFIDPIEDAVLHRRLRPLRTLIASLDLARSAVRGFRSPNNRPLNPAHMRSGARGEFDRSWVRIEATMSTRAIARIAARGHIASRRIAAYARYAEAFAGVPGCRPLLPRLPGGVVPFMFPLWVDHLSEVFPRLEDCAVPMQRFGQFLWAGAGDVCANSRSLSRHVVQFPCHQELTDVEIDWVVNQARQGVEAASR